MAPNLATAERKSSSLREICATSPFTPRHLYKQHRSGHVLSSGERQLILNASVHMPSRQPGLTVEEACAEIRELLGVSARTVLVVKKEPKTADRSLTTTSQKRPGGTGQRWRSAMYDDAGNWGCAVEHVDVEAKFKRDIATSARVLPVVIRLDEDDTACESDMSGVEPLYYV